MYIVQYISFILYKIYAYKSTQKCMYTFVVSDLILL